MKNYIFLITTIAFITFSTTSCTQEAKQDEVSAAEEAPHEAYIANAAFNMQIEGMACSHGCASAIEGKLNKTVGVEIAEVDFDNKRCVVKYDNTKVSEADLLKAVNELYDGKYKAVPFTEENQSESPSVEETNENS